MIFPVRKCLKRSFKNSYWSWSHRLDVCSIFPQTLVVIENTQKLILEKTLISVTSLFSFFLTKNIKEDIHYAVVYYACTTRAWYLTKLTRSDIREKHFNYTICSVLSSTSCVINHTELCFKATLVICNWFKLFSSQKD